MYRDLVFDLYGTLVDIHTDENEAVWVKTALYFGYYGAPYTGTDLRAAFDEAMRRREAHAGQSYECYPEIPVDEVMAELFRLRGVTEDADSLGLHAAQVFRIASTDYIRLYDGVHEALNALRSAGHRLWLLSNAQRAFTAYEMRLLDLDRHFDGICLSSDHGCRKPDQRFYRALTERFSLDASRCLMIGNDRETDIAGAKAAGMATLYMHTNLTPKRQAPACQDLPLSPVPCRRHFEYEGSDWTSLFRCIITLGSPGDAC